MTPLPCGMPSFVSPSNVVASSYTLLDQSSALPGGDHRAFSSCTDVTAESNLHHSKQA